MASDTLFIEKAPGIMRLLMMDFDLTVEEAAAILGNIGHECNGFRDMQEIDPVGGGRGGLGWCQWTGPRRRAFEAYVERNNLDPASDKANYGWLWVELKGPEKSAITMLRNAEGLREKVIAFERGFERAGIKHYDSRMAWAEKALRAYSEEQGDESVEGRLEALEARVGALEARSTLKGETEMAEVKIDIKKLDAAVRAAMSEQPKDKQPSAAKVEALEAFPSVKAGFATLGVIEDAQTTFCGAWPKVNATIKTALSFASWFLPAQHIALVKAVLAAINTQIIPAICGPKA